ALLRDRGEPAGLTRVACAVVLELAQSGLLRRLGHVRGGELRDAGGDLETSDQGAVAGDSASDEDRAGRRAGPGGMMLAALLREHLGDDERRAYLPLIIRAPGEALSAVDAIWYVRGRFAFLLEVEWTAMLGEAVLRRGREIPPSEHQARIVLFPSERTELVR